MVLQAAKPCNFGKRSNVLFHRMAEEQLFLVPYLQVDPGLLKDI